ncbi:MAG TPA: methyltransferase domain-containing protein [Spirochaetia bacterium]|nr:methyltransferase domain-containing protein [Spirochaetia bacterium]
MKSAWNPASYLRFEQERTLPSRDLATRIRTIDARSIVDVGCGPGNSTAVLKEHWPQARIIGLDSSGAMIAKARSAHPEWEWLLADAETWSTGERFDVIFSNAALQWMSDPAIVTSNLFAHLNEGGALAVQIPLIGESPLHRALVAVSERDAWAKLLRNAGISRNHFDESFYYNHLSTLTPHIEMWITIYLHVMESHRDIIDWYSSTGMRPFLDRISDEGGKKRFAQEVLDACRPEYPVQRDGRVLFPFKRLFFVARK